MAVRKRNRLVCGVGKNDASYMVVRNEVINGRHKQVWMCPFYQCWKDMLTRCYSAAHRPHSPTYHDCFVCDEWLLFSSFKAWMEGKNWMGMHLDKDTVRYGNREYCPEVCVFVTPQLNTFLNDRRAARGQWPIGVCFDRSKGKFRAECSDPLTGRKKAIGNFDSPAVAHAAWKSRKHELAQIYADMQTDNRIADFLRTRYLPEKEIK